MTLSWTWHAYHHMPFAPITPIDFPERKKLIITDKPSDELKVRLRHFTKVKDTQQLLHILQAFFAELNNEDSDYDAEDSKYDAACLTLKRRLKEFHASDTPKAKTFDGIIPGTDE